MIKAFCGSDNLLMSVSTAHGPRATGYAYFEKSALLNIAY
jgi:hypothetical protein